MKGKVYYRFVSDERRREVNERGWSATPWAATYNDLNVYREDPIEVSRIVKRAHEEGLYELAAEIEAGDDDPGRNEWVFWVLNNQDGPWVDHSAVKAVHTRFPRSMSVGDYIEWENGTKDFCKSVGWERFE